MNALTHDGPWNEFVWRGTWKECIDWLDRVGYQVPYLHRPAIVVHEGELLVWNTFTQQGARCDVGDTVRWYPTTRSFSVIKTL